MMVAFKRTLMAGGLLATMSGAALAMPAVVQNDLNLRAGPGTGYGVIDVMPQGAMVDAWACGPSWCRVNYGGVTGFASANYLDIGRAYVAPRYNTFVYSRPLAPLWPFWWL